MKEVEERLIKGKKNIDNIEVPDDMEIRLSNALKSHKPIRKKRNSWKVGIAAALVVVILIGYNFDTLAFYGKKLIGYDQVMNGTLTQLNELGSGQIIDRSYTFENGVKFTLDGIMIDENQLLAFYTIEAPQGDVYDFMPSMDLEGLISHYNMNGGIGEMNDERTIMKNMDSFEPPRFFERTLRLKIYLSNKNTNEIGEISFKIDRDRAMGHTLKQTINKTIEVDKSMIKVESILASPTKTVIKGSIQNLLDLAIDEIKDERVMPSHLQFKLIANDEEVQIQGSGMSTDIKGITFEQGYDALPQNLESLQLKLEQFSATHEVNKTIELNKNSKVQEFKINNQSIAVNGITESNNETLITITTEESVVLTRVYLLIDGKRVDLNRTFGSEYDKLKDGRINHTRTLEFPGQGENYKLEVVRMSYTKNYDDVIEIPIE